MSVDCHCRVNSKSNYSQSSFDSYWLGKGDMVPGGRRFLCRTQGAKAPGMGAIGSLEKTLSHPYWRTLSYTYKFTKLGKI